MLKVIYVLNITDVEGKVFRITSDNADYQKFTGEDFTVKYDASAEHYDLYVWYNNHWVKLGIVPEHLIEANNNGVLNIEIKAENVNENNEVSNLKEILFLRTAVEGRVYKRMNAIRSLYNNHEVNVQAEVFKGLFQVIKDAHIEKEFKEWLEERADYDVIELLQ